MKKIAVITADTVGERMAGPAIRAFEMAGFLARNFSVTLCSKRGEGVPETDFKVKDFSRAQEVIDEADVVIGHGLFFHKFNFRQRKGQKVIVDLYNIFLTENSISYDIYSPEERELVYQFDLYKLNSQLLLGDHFLCANKKQYDLIVGMLLALNKLNTGNMNSPPLTLVPFGLPGEGLEKGEENVLRGVHPAIGKEDFLLIWGGGIWDWLDPYTAIKAVKALEKMGREVKLFFMGTSHPDPDIKVKHLDIARDMARDMGLLDSKVIFNSWVPYEKRRAYLMEADLGISLHFQTLETRFSNRTRILDYIWCGLPLISTQGDSMSDLVRTEKLGRVVDYGKEEEVAQAVLDLAANSVKERENLARVREQFRWERVLEPLDELCRGGGNSGRKENKIGFSVGNEIKLDALRVLGRTIKMKGVGYTLEKFLLKIKGRL